ncbi:Uncharacterized protein FKW44_018626, partial [Caligus rogercresseyi]
SNEIESNNTEIASLKEELLSIKGSLETANTALSEWTNWGQSKMAEYDTLFKSYEEYVNAYNTINAELTTLKETTKPTPSVETMDKNTEKSLVEGVENKEYEDLKLQLSSSMGEIEKLKRRFKTFVFQMEKELNAIKKSEGGGSNTTECSDQELSAKNLELSQGLSSLQDELLESAKNMEDLNNERQELENKVDQLLHDNEVLRNVRADYESLRIKYDSLMSTNMDPNAAELNSQWETELQRKNEMLATMESELNNERLELDKSLRENKQLNSQMNLWKEQILTDPSNPGLSPENELHCARQAASAFQVQVEQLTTELTK